MARRVSKNIHEIRDPIHVFVRMDSHERRVLDSPPFQRLRSIHQLGMTYLVYPGATHRRFEHSLGVMELAGRVFDVITHRESLSPEIVDLVPEITREDDLRYWRRVLRMAALCHDMGHLPFSHAAEAELLPERWNHERLTRELVTSDEMARIWQKITPPLRTDDIVKLALGKEDAPDLDFSDWEAILAEVIVGDAFGVDRMDYLLRDSHHSGVTYGRFDHHRLIDCLRILTPPPTEISGSSREPVLGVEEGGLQSAEALMLARYFMYSQVYFHPIRRIYDIHLKDFLVKWLPEGQFSTDIEKHLAMTDNEVLGAISNAAQEEGCASHAEADRILGRQHFKIVYQRNPTDFAVNTESGEAIFKGLCDQFTPELIRFDSYTQKGGAPDFPVAMRDDRIESAILLSTPLKNLPVVAIGYVFADRTIHKEAESWVKTNRERLIQPGSEDEEDA